MKALTRTVTVFVVLNLAMGGIALAENAREEEAQRASIEALAAQKEAEAEKKGAEAALKQAVAATLRSRLGDVRVNLNQQLAKLQGYDGAGTVLVIPATGITTEDLIRITEDMNVMSRILDNRLRKERLPRSRLEWTFSEGHWLPNDIPEFLRRDGTETAGMYLQGYGALFLLKVDFPLSAPPHVREEQKEAKDQDIDPVWEQTRREIYMPDEVKRARRQPSGEKYDAEKVEGLKRTLITALKHAANIRGLKPDESVIITVIGREAAVFLETRTTNVDPTVARGLNGKGLYITKSEVVDSVSPTVLTVRAKKSDIDAFTKGELDFDQFRKQVTMFTYPYLAGDGGHGETQDLFFRSLPR